MRFSLVSLAVLCSLGNTSAIEDANQSHLRSKNGHTSRRLQEDDIPVPEADCDSDHDKYESEKDEIAKMEHEYLEEKFTTVPDQSRRRAVFSFYNNKEDQEHFLGHLYPSPPSNTIVPYVSFLAEYPANHEGTAADFTGPCYALPKKPEAHGWTKFTASDDQSEGVELDFAFELYGDYYPPGCIIFVNENGNLSFHYRVTTYFGRDFPITHTPMIAPFWADVDTRGGHGEIWYKLNSKHNTLSVIWDRVGYYKYGSNRRNTFQVVISDGTYPEMGLGDTNGGYNNICFCYGDMDYTTGDASGGWEGIGGWVGKPATVGINSGSYDGFFQLGRFGYDTYDFDASGYRVDGVHWLDQHGTIHPADKGPICFDTQTTKTNVIPPVCTGLPTENPVIADCHKPLRIEITCTTPDADQFVTIDGPFGWLPPDLVVKSVETSPQQKTITLEYTPKPGDAGDYTLKFVATDDCIDTNDMPASTAHFLTIRVRDCGMPGGGSQCLVPLPPPFESELCVDTHDPYPFCTAWISPEFCPASFPSLIAARAKKVRENAVDDDYWFHALEDKALASSFTTSFGYLAPKIYCCIDDVSDLFPVCIKGGMVPTFSFVIRVTGHHSSKGIYAFPNGFNDIDLISGQTKTLNDVVAEIAGIVDDGYKILVEEFVSGSGSHTNPALPTEFKLHMFNGKIGSISAVYNRGTDCACYAEFDQNFARLDTAGCFEPSDDNDNALTGKCHNTDYVQKNFKLTKWKGLDFCSDPLPPIDPCTWNDLLYIAKALSFRIGVYMRIDFFVDHAGKIYVQEYTANHYNGRRHCASRIDPDTKCIDSCFLGRMWLDAADGTPDALLYGGPKTTAPLGLTDWLNLDTNAQCQQALQLGTPPFIGTCGIFNVRDII